MGPSVFLALSVSPLPSSFPQIPVSSQSNHSDASFFPYPSCTSAPPHSPLSLVSPLVSPLPSSLPSPSIPFASLSCFFLHSLAAVAFSLASELCLVLCCSARLLPAVFPSLERARPRRAFSSPPVLSRLCLLFARLAGRPPSLLSRPLRRALCGKRVAGGGKGRRERRGRRGGERGKGERTGKEGRRERRGETEEGGAKERRERGGGGREGQGDVTRNVLRVFILHDIVHSTQVREFFLICQRQPVRSQKRLHALHPARHRVVACTQLRILVLQRLHRGVFALP